MGGPQRDLAGSMESGKGIWPRCPEAEALFGLGAEAERGHGLRSWSKGSASNAMGEALHQKKPVPVPLIWIRARSPTRPRRPSGSVTACFITTKADLGNPRSSRRRAAVSRGVDVLDATRSVPR